MEIKFIDEMSEDEIFQVKNENRQAFKELAESHLAVFIDDLNKTQASKDELQKINKRHKRGKW
tara:strand:+ start:567 stop:755 length:189 start_codon:yes stop_codon:yes gene_type:complete